MTLNVITSQGPLCFVIKLNSISILFPASACTSDSKIFLTRCENKLVIVKDVLFTFEQDTDQFLTLNNPGKAMFC